ncbi:MAG: PfkB family carbohydrate kinase, partial [Treponema sp.]|nr:PfkB family carbohydrate kinase [Treponema sp.]
MAVNEVELLCIGNAVVDIFVRSDEQEAIRLGITRHVQHIEIEKLREILRTLKIPETLNGPMTSSGCTIVSGGGAANVAKIAGLLGAKAGFIGAYGKETNEWAGAFQPDQFGRIFEKSLGAAGVKTWLTLKSSPTGLCLFLKVRDDTRIVASPSAALELSESNIRDEYLEKARVVVIDGFILDRPGLVRHILRRVNQYGAVAALDLSSPAIAKERSTEISGIARQYPLILFMNEDEAEAFYEGLG